MNIHTLYSGTPLAARAHSHPVLAPLIAAVLTFGLLLVPYIHSVASGSPNIPLFDPSQYSASDLATSTLNDGIPDAWKLYYGLSITDPTVANADYTGTGVMNVEKYRLNIYPLAPTDTTPQVTPLKSTTKPAAPGAKSATAPTVAPPLPHLVDGGFDDELALKNSLISTQFFGQRLTVKWSYVSKLGKWEAYAVDPKSRRRIEVWSVRYGDQKLQFVELDANSGSHGIKQEVQNAESGAFVLTWKHLGRDSKKAGDNGYKVLIYAEETSGSKRRFNLAQKIVTNVSKTKWEGQTLSFTVDKEDLKPSGKKQPTRKLWVALDSDDNNTYGTLIDDVHLLPIEILQSPGKIGEINNPEPLPKEGMHLSRWWGAYLNFAFAMPFNPSLAFPGNDPDRFIIRVPVGAVPRPDPLPANWSPKYTIKLSTLVPKGYPNAANYEDNATDIELTIKNDPKYLESGPMILVSDFEDDWFPARHLENQNEERIPPDDDKGPNEWTHVCAPGGRVRITVPDSNKPAEYPIKPFIKKVELDIAYTIKPDQSKEDEDDLILEIIKSIIAAREIYAQEHIQIVVSQKPRLIPWRQSFDNVLANRSSQDTRDIADTLIIEDLTKQKTDPNYYAEAKILLDALKAKGDKISVFFFPCQQMISATQTNVVGHALCEHPDAQTPAFVRGSIIISSKSASKRVLSHEIGHKLWLNHSILDNNGSQDPKNASMHNLMFGLESPFVVANYVWGLAKRFTTSNHGILFPEQGTPSPYFLK